MNNVILSAIDSENYYIRYFYVMANRFCAFDPGVSWLFRTLAEEGINNKWELMRFANRLIKTKNNLIANDNGYKENTFDYMKHFFVVNREMALNLMETAINMKTIHQLFYEQCCSAEIEPLLRLFYKRLSLSEKQHTQVLEESMERFYTDIHLGIRQA